MIKRSQSQKFVAAKKDFLIKSSAIFVKNDEDSHKMFIKKKATVLGRPTNLKMTNYHGYREPEYTPPPSEQLIKDVFYVQSFGVTKTKTSDTGKRSNFFGSTFSKPRATQSEENGNQPGSLNTTIKAQNSPFFMPPTVKQPGEKLVPVTVNKSQLKGLLMCNVIRKSAAPTVDAGSEPPAKKPKMSMDPDLEMKDIGARYLANAKRYNLKDLEDDDEFLGATVISYEKVKECFNALEGNYTQPNLQNNKAQLNTIFSQDYQSIAFAIEPTELISITYNMLLWDLIQDEFIFLNSLAVMYRSLEQVLLKPLNFPISNICKKVFSLINHLRRTKLFSQAKFIAAFYHSFNSLGESVRVIDPEVLREYLRPFMRTLQALLNQEMELALAEEMHSVEKKPGASFLKGLEELFKVSRVRTLFLTDEQLRDALVRFVEYLKDRLQQVSFSFSRVPQVVHQILLHYSSLFTVIKYQSLNELCAASIPSFEQSTLTKMLFSLLFTASKQESISQDFKSGIDNVLSNCSRMVEVQSEAQVFPSDQDYYLELYFKMHFDQDSKFVQPTNIEFAKTVAKLVKCLLTAGDGQNKKHMSKMGKLKISSIIRLYSDMMVQINKMNMDEVPLRRLLELLLSILKA